METKNIIFAGIGVGALYLGYKAIKKRKDLNKGIEVVNSVSEEIKPIPSDKYTKEQATAKALITVKDWIKTYDSLSEDVLNEKSKNYFRDEKKLNELKAKTNPSREELMEIQILNQKFFISNNATLKDAVKRLKDMEYQKIYNILKDLYAQYPKKDVDKLMVLLPKYLSGRMLGDDYKYTYDVYDKLTIDDKLFLSDIDFDKKFDDIYQLKYPRRTLVDSNVGIKSTGLSSSWK